MVSPSPGEVCAKSEQLPVADMVRLLASACRFVPFSTCLSRAIAGNRLLRSYGVWPTLHIGVAKENEGELEAHAWLSLEGNIILGDTGNLKRFSELPPFALHRGKEEP